MVFDVNCDLDGEWPEPVAEVSIDEECTDYRSEGLVASFSDAILVQGIRDSFFIGDASGFCKRIGIFLL